MKPQGYAEGLSAVPAQAEVASCEGSGGSLMEQVAARQNMLAALRRVERNGGAPGVDGVTVKDLRDLLRRRWEQTREELLRGTYKPQPVRRVEIPKPSGGVRMLGIPTVLDRLIQQALLQVLTPIFDPGFSEASYGFRPGRKAHDAVKKAREYVEEGYRWVVDIDLEKFFDRVNHDKLMARVARKVTDRRVLRVIRAYLEAGVLAEGVVVRSEEGTPQGGPLSPLLANIMLDDLDKELERRGHRFVRYADDCNIYVRSRRAGERVMGSVRRYLQERLRLKVNETKSAVDRPWRRKFLGFSMYYSPKGLSIRIAPESLERLKERIRELTSRRRSQAMAERICRLNELLRGWVAYFALADARKVLARIDAWLKRRLRMCVWKQWKRYRTRVRELRAHEVPEWLVCKAAGTRRGPWYAAGSAALNKALGTAYWQAQGLVSLVESYDRVREAW